MSQVGNKTSTSASDVQFNADVDVEAELEEMKRQVDSLQEDLQLKTLQENAAKDEGVRKTTNTTLGIGASGTSNLTNTATTTSGSNSVTSGSNNISSVGATKVNTSVFVGNLDARTTENDLRVFFAPCGTIERVTVLKDRYSGQPKGTAYVEFASAEQAQSAVVKDGQSLHGKPLKVAPKRDNIPAFQRGLGRGAGNMLYGRGRGNFAANAASVGGANPVQQQMAALAMMASMMGGAPVYSPYGPPRGRGRGRGRGAHESSSH